MKLWDFLRSEPFNYGKIFGDQFPNIAAEFYSGFSSDYKSFDLIVDDLTKELVNIDWNAGFCFFRKPIRQQSNWILASHNQEETVSLVLDGIGHVILEFLDFESGATEFHPIATDFSQLTKIVVPVE